jgi:pimeloyl-ACP methyl ester carboxylesterase
MTALILLPGLDGTGDLFAPLLGELSKDLQPIIVRYPAREPLGYSRLRQLVLETLPSNGTFVILGESFSGPVAISVAAHAPERCRGVLLCASFVSSPVPLAKVLSALVGVAPIRWAARTLWPRRLMGRFASADVRSLMFAALDAVSDEVLRTRIREVLSVDVSSELAGLDLPTLYLQATEDAAMPKAAAVKFARLARRGRVEAVVGPHFLLQCSPAAAARAIESFVRGL